jgi:2-deoxy-D-gluconate 3-dehydrogenase
MFKKVLLVGASRGLGNSLLKLLPQTFSTLESLTAVSRSEILVIDQKINPVRLDMSKSLDQELLLEKITEVHYDLILYVAGGGPHGDFEKREWKDHDWALQTSLIAPMKLINTWLRSKTQKGRGRFVVVGSKTAESQPDPRSASYAASKHGLIGLISSLQGELKHSDKKVFLFSPPYMDTQMLPATAIVRHNGAKIISAESAANYLLKWIQEENPNWHFSFN